MAFQHLPLHDRHTDLGAKMAPFANHTMPMEYGSVNEEVFAVRKNRGLFDISHMGEFVIEGVDAVVFCDYMMTNNFAGVKRGKAVYSPLCNEQGKVLDDIIAYKLSEEKVLLCVNASNREKDWKWIKERADGFEVNIRDSSEQTSLLALQGPTALMALKEAGLVDISLPSYSVMEISFRKQSVIVATTGYTGEDGVEIFSNHKTIREIWDILYKEGAVPCGLVARDILRLEMCYPLYGNELTEKLTPFDANLGWTVKMEKENFIGKNALKDYKPVYKLLKFFLDKGIPRKGYPVLDDKGREIGLLTSGTYSPCLKKGIALGPVQREKMPENGEFFIKIRQRVYKAQNCNKTSFIGEK